MEKIRLDFKSSYDLKLVAETTKKELERNGFNHVTNTRQTNIGT